MPSEFRPNGSESILLDQKLAEKLDSDVRNRIWTAVEEILSNGPIADIQKAGNTGLALGYVQSGKTTTITALLAKAADDGYRIIITFLGSTNVLLTQNANRIESSLGIGDKGDRRDYRWVSLPNPSGSGGVREITDWIRRDRVILIPVLKHAGRIDALAEVLRKAKLQDVATLIVDDEADQASLNTELNEDQESKTYAAIGNLRKAQPRHLYVQFTATPYAPLLLHPSDHLAPNFVTFLHPGKGYTGGREFFVDYAEKVIRPIPMLDEQPARSLPTDLPNSLKIALANFFLGASILLKRDLANAPISMLVHSTQKNDVQARYQYLITRQIRQWRELANSSLRFDDLPKHFVDEYTNLRKAGVQVLAEDSLLIELQKTLLEATTWLLNSATSIKKINWNITPVHILVGGNKLDRGFTVEGLTVTYMNRPTTDQIDTLEQRARAFGYRGELLPFCQFFATPRTLKLLREIVFTEYDLRAKLQDWLAKGGSVATWSEQVGLMLPSGTKPSRLNVLETLSRFNSARSKWHSLRRIEATGTSIRLNKEIVANSGLLEGAYETFGRLEHRVIEMSIENILEKLLEPWHLSSYSPEWRHAEILDFLKRQEDQQMLVKVILLELEPGVARIRDWDQELGFINLFQGEDVVAVPGKAFYPGDRKVPFENDDDSGIAVQIHHVRPRNDSFDPSYTLAVHLGRGSVVKRERESK